MEYHFLKIVLYDVSVLVGQAYSQCHYGMREFCAAFLLNVMFHHPLVSNSTHYMVLRLQRYTWTPGGMTYWCHNDVMMIKTTVNIVIFTVCILSVFLQAGCNKSKETKETTLFERQRANNMVSKVTSSLTVANTA